MRIIKTCQGLGDAAWVLQKLVNAKERFNFQIHAGSPQRGKQIFDLLPQIAASCEYVPGLPYSVVGPRNIQRQKKYWRLIQEQEFFLSANEYLESGQRIETFLPDLPTSYSLPFQTAEWEEVVKTDFPEGPYIGIYASAYSTARAWGFWGSTGWFDLIWEMHQYIPEATFVQIGADWDIGVADEIRALMVADHVPFISTIGKPLGYVIEMMKRLTYGFYFPSGLGILSGLLARPSVMFYPEKSLPKLPRTWCDPELIGSSTFKECFFCTPKQIADWVKDVYQLKSKL
jgi:ADP-heptose:LPS heptosyltransferase